jgi:DNA polymerase-3 subunit beta
MNLLERNLIDPDEQILVAIRSNEVLFKAGRANLYGRLVEGRYPPYREVFPKKMNSQVIVGAGQLLAVVRQAAILTDQESRGVDFQFAENKLTLRIRAEKGRAKVELPISYDHAPITIKMDPRFVSDMVRTIPHDAEIQLNLADGNTPVLFSVGSSYRYLVMPSW